MNNFSGPIIRYLAHGSLPFLNNCVLWTCLSNLCAFLKRRATNFEGPQVAKAKWPWTDGGLFGNGPLCLQRFLSSRAKPRSVIIYPSSAIHHYLQTRTVYVIWPKMSQFEKEHYFGITHCTPQCLRQIKVTYQISAPCLHPCRLHVTLTMH